MPLPCEFRSLSYSQNRNLALNLCPKPEHLNPPRGKTSSGPKVITGTAAGNAVTVLDWFKAWHDVAAGFLRSLCFELWDKSICGFAFRANTASASLEIPPHQIAAKCEIIPSSIQVKQVKGSSFHELWNHSESCLACLGWFTVSLYHHQCPIIFLEHS